MFHLVWNIIRYKVHSGDHLLLAHESSGANPRAPPSIKSEDQDTFSFINI